MKIVVIGGSGLIGKKVVTNLRQHGDEVVAASPSSGVNTVTGRGADVILSTEGISARRRRQGSLPRRPHHVNCR